MGEPFLPYGRQWVDEDDIRAVVDVLRSDWLTTGPVVNQFEQAVADVAGARHAVAVSSGTAALHAAMFAVGVGPGDEVIVPPITFAATANAVVYRGATPIFADVDPDTLLIDPEEVARKVTGRTRAVIAVDYAGQPCDYGALRKIADRCGLTLVADACHSLGGTCDGRPVGSLADLTVFSFHPVKHITTGEGGMVTTDSDRLAAQMRLFRNHGITSDHRQRAQHGSWFYEMTELGYNYRLTDIQCALGMSQLRKLPQWLIRRREIAAVYRTGLGECPEIRPLKTRSNVDHAYHLFAIKLDLDKLNTDRSTVFQRLLSQGIGVNVHYVPVHLHRFYRERFGTGPGLCPIAEAAYERLLTLPLFPAMKDEDVLRVLDACLNVRDFYSSLRSAT
jgi:perosamine synthetase